MRLFAREQIPAVAKEIAENGDGAVGFVARVFFKGDASGLHRGVFCHEIIGFEEIGHPTSARFADPICLIPNRPRNEKRGFGIGMGRHHDPAFTLLRCVLNKVKTKAAGEPLDRSIVIVGEIGDERKPVHTGALKADNGLEQGSS